MANRKGHTTKNRLQREQYVKYIKQQDYEPTKEEGLDFKDSSDKEEDFSISKTNKTRRLPLREQLKDHFDKHWIEWLVGGLSVVLIFFTFSAKIQLSGHEIKIDQNKSDIEKNNNRIDEIDSKNVQQDLQIQDSKLRIEYLNKNPEENKLNGK